MSSTEGYVKYVTVTLNAIVSAPDEIHQSKEVLAQKVGELLIGAREYVMPISEVIQAKISVGKAHPQTDLGWVDSIISHKIEHLRNEIMGMILGKH